MPVSGTHGEENPVLTFPPHSNLSLYIFLTSLFLQKNQSTKIGVTFEPQSRNVSTYSTALDLEEKRIETYLVLAASEAITTTYILYTIWQPPHYAYSTLHT